jgi:hypothetical protein
MAPVGADFVEALMKAVEMPKILVIIVFRRLRFNGALAQHGCN